MADFTLYSILACAGALLAGGWIKGMLGVGLPMVAIPLMAAFIPLREAIAIMYGPVLLANAWQALRSGYFLTALKRFWPMMASVVVGTWFGSKMLVTIDPRWLEGIVGASVAGFSLVTLLNPTFRVSERHALWISLIIGITGGFFGGLTLFIGPAVIMFLVALHVQKEEFIGTITLVYLLGVVPTGVFYVIDGTLRQEHLVPTLLACIPVIGGMVIGTLIRGHINEILFRKILLITLVVIGLNMIRKAMF
jgi:uncharacterized membrane protein YfcA